MKAEKEQQDRQAQFREAEREHELQLARKKADQGSANQSRQGNPSQTSTGTAKPKITKIPMRSMMAWILSSKDLKGLWRAKAGKRDEWAVCLSPLLTRKGFQIFSSMPSDEVLQCDILKRALLKRYEKTEEGFRNKSRHTKPEQGETAHQFVARLQRYFNRWVDMSGCVKEYKELADLLIREQFVNYLFSRDGTFPQRKSTKEHQ